MIEMRRATTDRLETAVPAFLAVLVGGILWEVVGQASNVPFFPPLSAVLQRMAELVATGQILENLAGSLTNLAVGFGLSLVIGVGLGLCMGLWRRFENALDVYVYTLLTTPTIVLAPILFSIFGLGREPIIILIVTYSGPTVIVNTMAAVKNVPTSIIDMARSFCPSRRQLITRIILPASMPLTMAGVRLGAGRAVKGMINGEMFIVAVGLGGLVMRAGRAFDAETVLAVLLVTILVVVGLVGLVQLVDRRVNRWLPDVRRQ